MLAALNLTRHDSGCADITTTDLKKEYLSLCGTESPRKALIRKDYAVTGLLRGQYGGVY